jgi:hypothetical protein
MLRYGPVLTAVAAVVIVALFRLPWLSAGLLRIRVLPVRYRLAVPAALAAAVAAAGGVATFVEARVELSRVDAEPVVELASRTAPAYAPLTVVAAVTLTLGWALLVAVLAVGRVRRVRRVWSGVAVAVVLAVVAAVGAVGVNAYGTGGEGTTAQPLPDRPPGVPKDLGRVAWSGGADGPVTVVGRYLVTSGADTIMVRDVVTGGEHWHFRRPMLDVPGTDQGYRQAFAWTVPRFGISADRRTVVTLWSPPDGADIVAGFDLAGGRLLWSREMTVDRSPPSLLTGEGWIFQIGDTAIVTWGANANAIDVRTGRQWRWQPPAGCRVDQFAQATDVLVAAVACGRDIDRIVGVSATDGVERWTWPTPSAGEHRESVAVIGATVRVLTREHGDVTLDAASGAVRHSPTPRRVSSALRGQDVTVYLDTSQSDPMATAVDSAGTTRWETRVPGLARVSVTHTVVDGGVGYALVEPFSAAGTRTRWNQRLLAFDLTTGAVLAAHDILIPTECACHGGSLDLAVLPGAGMLTLAYVATAGQPVGLVVYA